MKFGNGLATSSTLYHGCNYLSMFMKGANVRRRAITGITRESYPIVPLATNVTNIEMLKYFFEIWFPTSKQNDPLKYLGKIAAIHLDNIFYYLWRVAAIHYNDVIMGMITFLITSLTIVYSTVYSDADERKHQSPASLAFVRGIHRRPVNSPHKWPVTRKMFHLMTSSCGIQVPEESRA